MALLKKGQIRMFETIAILLVFFILLVIVIVFYANVRQSSNIEKTRDYRELRAIENMNKLLFLPEIQCSQGSDVYTCIDTIKLDALSDVMSRSENVVYYAELFGESSIEVEQLYPVSWNKTLYDRADEGIFVGIPVSLWDPVTDSYGYGLLKIRTG